MNVIVTKTGFKTSPKGKVINSADKAADLFGSMTKGAARKFRKLLRTEGLAKYAAVPARRAA